MGSIPFALQLYTVRDKMGQDAAATLKRVKAIGYDYVELAGTAGLSPGEFKAILDDVGLTAIASHVGFDDATKNVGQAIDEVTQAFRKRPGHLVSPRGFSVDQLIRDCCLPRLGRHVAAMIEQIAVIPQRFGPPVAAENLPESHKPLVCLGVPQKTR